LIIVPIFYSLIAEEHHPVQADSDIELATEQAGVA
jgi:hypothetical protein